MLKHHTWWSVVAFFLLSLCGASAQAAKGAGGEGGQPDQATANDSPLPRIDKVTGPKEGTVVRGSPVTVEGRNFGHKRDLISLTLGGLELGHPLIARETWLTFTVPATIGKDKEKRPFPLGEALLRISVKSPQGEANVEQMAADPYDNGKLHVVADSSEQPKLTGALPLVGTARDFTKLTLMGNGFPHLGRDLSLLVDGVEVELCFSEQKCDVWAQVSGHQLVLQGKNDPKNASMTTLSQLFGVGKHQLALRFGEQEPTDAVAVTITRYNTEDIRTYALLASGVILGLMVLLVLLGGSYKVGRTEYLVRAFLIDSETEAYSLAKLQFFLWSVAALLAYAYLVLARFMVQGHLELPEVPDGLPGIISVSAGTTIGSLGITAMRGPKGAGSAQPSFSDLVCVGGVVSPERFQFLLWTIVAVTAFLGATLQLDPLQIDTVPKIPQTLLVLSGISSAGYLGGRLVRQPGPVISNVLVSSGSLLLTISGRNLSRFARFEINGKSLSALLSRNTTDASPFRATVLEPETGKDDFAKSLSISIDKPDPEWLKSSKQPPALELALINEDGQRSAYSLEINADVWRAFTGAPTEPSAAPATPATPVSPPDDPGVAPSDNTSHDSTEPEKAPQ